jgi:hypothetical protein
MLILLFNLQLLKAGRYIYKQFMIEVKWRKIITVSAFDGPAKVAFVKATKKAIVHLIKA